jgi:hypothetical protein
MNLGIGFGLHLRTTRRRAEIVDLLCQPDIGMGCVAAGSVHHIAFRAKDQAEQLQWREHLLDVGYNVTPVIDRTYFIPFISASRAGCCSKSQPIHPVSPWTKNWKN